MEMGHPRSPTPVQCDKSTATGMKNDSAEKQRSRWMEMKSSGLA